MLMICHARAPFVLYSRQCMYVSYSEKGTTWYFFVSFLHGCIAQNFRKKKC